MDEIRDSMTVYLSTATEQGNQVLKGTVLNQHPTNNRLWLVKSGETLLWMLQEYIYATREAISF